MQIVIEIPEETFKAVMMGSGLSELAINTICDAIYDGTLLPKGHGRLIDAYEIIEQANNMADELDNDYTIADIEKVGTLLESISTIIEADKAGKEQE